MNARSARQRRASAGATYSALVAWTAAKALPSRLRPLAYRAFARAVGANLDETELALGEYESLGDFFARRLRDGARTIASEPQALISPCDGVVAAIGTAVDGALVQAKGRNYQLSDLLVDDELTTLLTGGAYTTIYLSPRDYHRVHTPVDATVESYDYVPGYLWPVNPRLATRRDGLLARNERVVIRLNSPEVGRVALVMVAAAGVGNIRLTRGPDSASLRAGGERHRVELDGLTVKRGDELGAFRLGSTVVMVFEPGHVELTGQVGQAVQFGQGIGALVPSRGGLA
ncbi:MAG: phosphatidylserine decarboxylase [Deltaproteobacteria bacterium]|nr:phosphatidylserine decarboxylase [Deltaproteobacteria bacterium]MDQ3299544.1 archaetidylserine decarboxylase [Myxococcota bacterium]